MATALTYTALCVAVADYLGWGRNTEGEGDDWDDTTENRLSDIIDAGYKQLLYPPIVPGEATAHRWSFLRPKETLVTVSGTYLYDMPAAFGAIVGDLVYDADEDISRIVVQASPAYIDKQRAINDADGRPTHFALRPRSVEETSPQLTECMLWPTPDAAYDLAYHYDAHVATLSATNPYPLGGQAHADTILQSCRDIAAQRYRDQPAGPEHDLFLQRLQASVEFDRRNSPKYLGYNNDVQSHCFTRHGSDFTCTLKHNLG